MRKNILIYMAIMVLGSLFFNVSVFSQEDITAVEDSAFDVRQIMRPPVPFFHDEHNEKAGVEECNICHHTYEDGKKVEDDSSEGMECSECHTLEDKSDPAPLVRVYHLQCKGCHEERKAGPVMCGECHIK
ncbi:cytochrome c3 family protein [Desulfococcaceae bacterium HSG8]|nr:cytochrome c3 family protein [Desulfococcaceae bacterium HSG8]